MANLNSMTHGETLGGRMSPEYCVWKAMLQRCRNPNNPRYASYGGRGIRVCVKWQNDFAAFLLDMGRRPTSRHSIERINNDGDYKPSNCRWELPGRQMVNRRNTRTIHRNGKDVPLADLAKKHGIPANTLRFRVLGGWDLERALTQPVRPKRSASVMG
jgi:hypothetical protein